MKNTVDRYVDIIVAWHQLEQQLDAPEIIDFNLLEADQSPVEFENRYQVYQALLNLLKTVDDDKFRKKVTAHLYYLRALMGQQIPFAEYIENTQHIPVKYFDEDYLDAARRELISALTPLKINYGDSIYDDLEAVDEVIPNESLEAFFKEQFAKNRGYLEAALNRPVDYKLRIEMTSVDAYWSNWVDGWGDNFRLRINTFAGNYTRARSIQLVYHELLAHCAQMAIWKEQIDQGQMSKIWGLTTVHGPEQFLFEGLAQTLPLFLENEVTRDPVLIAQIYFARYSKLVWNNLHIKINSGESLEDCLTYATERLPWLKQQRILSGLESRSNHILFRSYLYVYPSSMDFFLELAYYKSSKGNHNLFEPLYYKVLIYNNLKNEYLNDHY